MAKSYRSSNPVVLNAGMKIGASDAEFDDEFLLPCFVHYPPVEACLNVSSRGMVIDGRTGAGKTAILKYVASKAENFLEIDPSEMSMSYVSNSDVLNFLHAIGADLDLMFQVLWKHVLCIEYIRLRYKVTNEQASETVFERLKQHFLSDARKQKAIKYLKEWEGKFWVTMDQNIKELTEKVEKAVQIELGGEIEKFKAGGQYDKRLSVDKKSEFVSRVRKIINADQLAQLAGVIDMLAEVDSNGEGASYYLLIDKLDENWVDVSVRFRLIRALVESLKSFRRIRNLKILVALRSDILERVVQETHDLTFQREKLDDYFVHIKWTKSLLKDLVNKRIQALFKRQYTQKALWFDDIFPYNVGNIDPFEYIIERTLLRPRDVIAYVNECLEAAQGNYEVSGTVVKKAEGEYSRVRKHALEQEWQSAFPSIKRLLDHAGSKKKSRLTVSELFADGDADELAMAIYTDAKFGFDPLFEVAEAHCKNNGSTAFEKTIVSILYRVGAIGVKLSAGERFIYSHIDHPLLPLEKIGDDVPIRIHPMLYGAFHLQRD